MLTNHHPRTILLNLSTIEKVNQDKALSIFAERFANPADFTFIFTGNIDPQNESLKKFICTYLGGLRTTNMKETFTDDQIRKPEGRVNNHFTKEMKVKKASNFIAYHGQMPFNLQNRTAMSAIGNILNIRYLESVREKEGGSYGVGVRGSIDNKPIEDAILMIQFDTDPEKQPKMISIIYDEINNIIANGPRKDDVQKVKETMLKKYAEDVENNGWWQNAIYLYYQDHLNLVTDYKSSVEEVTPLFIQTTLKKLVDQNNVIEVIMMPKE